MLNAVIYLCQLYYTLRRYLAMSLHPLKKNNTHSHVNMLLLSVYRSRQQIFTVSISYLMQKYAVFILINMFINIPPTHCTHVTQCNYIYKYEYIGYHHSRARRTTPIALNHRGWHWKYEPQQLGGHATGTEGNCYVAFGTPVFNQARSPFNK